MKGSVVKEAVYRNVSYLAYISICYVCMYVCISSVRSIIAVESPLYQCFPLIVGGPSWLRIVLAPDKGFTETPGIELEPDVDDRLAPLMTRFVLKSTSDNGRDLKTSVGIGIGIGLGIDD